MENKVLFVQFIHPGGEHGPDNGDQKRWNTGAHKRKFLQSRGRYVNATALDVAQEDELTFWGEWEADSTVIHTIASPVPHGPHWIHRPHYGELPEEWAQNTDPFVFGDRFLYSNCKQWTKLGPTQMTMLDRGSVILFGSCITLSEFVVDTVFVVDSWVDYALPDYAATLDGKVPATFEDVTLSRLAYYAVPCLRLYFGATHENPVEGMFSFFPCMTRAQSLQGFARPTIRMDGLITNNLTMGRKGTAAPDLCTMAERWQSVVAQMRHANMQLGVWAELPERVGTAEREPRGPRSPTNRGCRTRSC